MSLCIAFVILISAVFFFFCEAPNERPPPPPQPQPHSHRPPSRIQHNHNNTFTMSYWKSAGMTYLQYVNVATTALRSVRKQIR